ncbi:hypothetical protein HYPSUDRAFT_44651, partial [Hypholoma sublateritium FD-334 SS-4]
MFLQLKAWVAFALTSALLANTVIAIPIEAPVSPKGKRTAPCDFSTRVGETLPL